MPTLSFVPIENLKSKRGGGRIHGYCTAKIAVQPVASERPLSATSEYRGYS